MLEVENKDVIEWANRYAGPKFHAILTDPPYHLVSDRGSSRGFMGQKWDGGDIAFQSETWKKLGEHLYPGAFGMAFASSRGYHRMAVAIEDSGMIIHPSIFGWVYGNGFPKATRIKGDERFQGHRYGLQALKPALEPIIVFQKPYDGRPMDNIKQTGAGSLWIDGARIPASDKSKFPAGVVSETENVYGGGNGMYADRPRTEDNHPNGRWPANFIMDEYASRSLDEKSGVTKSSDRVRHNTAEAHNKTASMGASSGDWDTSGYSDIGGASRFFFSYQYDNIESNDPVAYIPKASRKERDAGLDDFEAVPVNPNYGKGGFSRPTGEPDREIAPFRNPHPTVKPISLARYLATILLPPDDFSPRRILVPFSGVGSEMIGCMQAGWEYSLGIEQKSKYCQISKARFDYWQDR